MKSFSTADEGIEDRGIEDQTTEEKRIQEVGGADEGIEGRPMGAERPDFDDLDRRLLEMVQEEFPLKARPFLALGEALGIGEEEAIRRAGRLRDLGIIRRIGPVLDMRRLGFSGVLVALPVSDGKMEEVAQIVNGFQEISHNYLRPNETRFNMWFTISASQARIEEILSEIKEKTGLDQLVLPTERIFKIGVRFDIPE